jgi:pentatricopeptide repeat domain-containing protein 1
MQLPDFWTIIFQKDYGVQPNAVVFSSVISACSSAATEDPSYCKTALQLLKEVQDKGLDMSVVGYNAALGACSHAANWKAAIDLFEEMLERNIVDEVSYATVMAACESGEQWDLVLQYADKMQAAEMHLDALAVTTILHACQQKGLAQEALQYLEMLKQNPNSSMMRRKTAGWERLGARSPLQGPDSVAYRLAISACARGGEYEKGIELLGDMKVVTGNIDVIAYTAAITGCEYAGEWRKAFSVLEMMQKNGVAPNEVTMAATIGACATACAQGQEVNLALKKALQVLSVMKKDTNVIDPNIAVYNAAIRTCGEANRLDIAFRLLQDAENQGLEPTVVTFGTLMTACERQGHVEGMNRVFQMLKAADIQPNEIICGAAISCLRKANQPERALLLLKKMIKDGLNPNVATFNTVLIAQTEGRQAKLENALEAFKLMLASNDAKANRQTYVILIRAFCANLQPRGAEALLRKMHHEGIKPDVDLYTMTVTAYEKTRQPLRALQLMESMENDGYDFYSIKVLNEAFKNAVKLVNAVGKSLSDNNSLDGEEWNERLNLNPGPEVGP